MHLRCLYYFVKKKYFRPSPGAQDAQGRQSWQQILLLRDCVRGSQEAFLENLQDQISMAKILNLHTDF